MRRWLTGLVPLLFAGCLSVPESGAPVHGTEVGVIVHNYALAFRDFLSAETPRTQLPSFLNAPLPLTDAEWSADGVTTSNPVTTTTAGMTSVSKVHCSPTHCVREIMRQFEDGFRNDESLHVYYARHDTASADDDAVLAFESRLRYADQTIAVRQTTAPTGGEWKVTTEVGFPGHDYRLEFTRTETYSALTSDAVPGAVDTGFRTKEGEATAALAADADGWQYAEAVSYESFRTLRRASAEFKRSGDSFRGERRLIYASGVEIDPQSVEGSASAWDIAGSTVALGDVQGTRGGDSWERTIVFPDGSRFKELTDRGTYPDENRQGTFVREIVGIIDTLRIEGTYREKIPGVWEVKAMANQGIRLEFIYQSLDFSEAFEGFWVQPNPRLNSQDTSEFSIRRHPDWTTKMSYNYDRSDTTYPIDESGVLVFTPDTRGAARVSVVQDEAGDISEHRDYNLRIVAEGQEAE